MKSLGWIIAGSACLGLGCEPAVPSNASSKPSTQQIQWDAPARITMSAHLPTAADARDPHPQLGAMVHLDIYVLNLPIGTVSKNEEVWKRVDEQAIGITDADRLNRNGMRCGIVPLSESLYFSQFFDRVPHQSTRSVVDDLHSNTVKLAIEKNFAQQDLFFFNAKNQLQGQSFDSGFAELMLAYGPTPRNPGSVRLVFCPTIRSDKKRMHFTTLNDEYEMTANAVDRLYDAGLTINVPDDSFFIMAPNTDALRSTSVGGVFLTRSDQPEETEQVILVMPTLIKLDGTPSTLPGLMVKPTPTTLPLQSLAQ